MLALLKMLGLERQNDFLVTTADAHIKADGRVGGVIVNNILIVGTSLLDDQVLDITLQYVIKS